jgi:hypothetical protein
MSYFKTNLINFVLYWFPPLILLIGLTGNLLGCIIIWRPKLKNIGPRNIYKYLFIMDTIYLLEIVFNYSSFGFGKIINNVSDIICKLTNYFGFSLAVISPMLIVYISFDRYISIKYPAKRFLFRKAKIQFIYFIIIFLFNLIYYLPVFFSSNLNLTHNNTFQCSLGKNESLFILFLMDVLNRVILPFGLMLIGSILLIYSLFKSRTRIVENFLADENKTFYTEIRLATTSLSLNLIYILLNLPISVINFSQLYDNLYMYIYCYYLFYLSYSLNFYILLISNSLFQNEFFEMIKIKKVQINNNNNNIPLNDM